MSSHRVRLRPRLIIPERKHETDQSPPNLKGGAGHLSPDLKPNTPPVFPENECENHIECIGKYLLLEPLDSCEKFQIFKSVHIETQEEFTCKVIPIENYRKTLSAYWRVDAHENITQIEEIVLGETKAYVFFARSHGDLHSYVRSKRKLKELEAARLFHQVVKAVCFCHENGVILRDLKLRKFVFKNEERTELMLEGLEDACVLDDESNDLLGDKHGCPAYVSPEILTSTEGYSGKSADIWSLGVMLYTVLIGRYPFHDTEPGALFTKIRRGQYSIPDSISSRAKCLIRSLLRRSPDERLTADEVLQHPWFKIQPRVSGSGAKERKNEDQAVPMIFTMDDDPLFL